MTPEERARAKELCERATPGPWIWDTKDSEVVASKPRPLEDCPGEDRYNHCSCGWKRQIVETDQGHYPPFHNDGPFIAESRTLLPQALGEIEQLERALDRACEWLHNQNLADAFCGLASAGTFKHYLLDDEFHAKIDQHFREVS